MPKISKRGTTRDQRLSLWASLLTREILTYELLPIIRLHVRLLTLVRWSLLSLSWIVHAATISAGAPIHVQWNGNFIIRNLRQGGVQIMILSIIVRTLTIQVLDITQVFIKCLLLCHMLRSRRSIICWVHNPRRRRRFTTLRWTSRRACGRNDSG